MQIKKRLLELKPELIAQRRDFHAHPELGFKHPRFTIDEDALIIGAELYVRTALRFFNASN